MSMKMEGSEAPRGERMHIAIFGSRNAGKSSLINALTNQELSIVSEVKGTTTDPVYKSMELLPLGPVVLIDTPGLDDEGELGEQRVKKAMEVLRKTDLAILVLDGEAPDGRRPYGEKELCEAYPLETELKGRIREQKIPFLTVINKVDLWKENGRLEALARQYPELSFVSARTKEGIEALKTKIAGQAPEKGEGRRLLADLLGQSDVAVLVVPIDSAAPKGRLILPQQQTIRDILEAEAIAVVTRETKLEETLAALGRPPKLVITDSQVFAAAARVTPKEVWLTSFSILFARYKGDLRTLAEGAGAVETLSDGDLVLMAEGCTHHRQCGDIGTVKIPNWLLAHTGKKLLFETSSGGGFPEKLGRYKLIVHCGGCMLNEREMKYRMEQAGKERVPIVNYGILIAYMKGILKRSLEPFPSLADVFK